MAVGTALAVVVLADGEVAGTVTLWIHEGSFPTESEIGWMVLPSFQGRGIGRAATADVLNRARADGRWGTVHAYPAVDNAPSNAMCRSLGFTLVEMRDFEYAGRSLTCNDWALDLTAAPS
jgi:RimJ/RimL family protein N-acetyltransferase